MYKILSLAIPIALVLATWNTPEKLEVYGPVGAVLLLAIGIYLLYLTRVRSGRAGAVMLIVLPIIFWLSTIL